GMNGVTYMGKQSTGVGNAIVLSALLGLLSACGTVDPVNVAGGVFFDQSCPRAHAIYTVPEGKLLIIEDASASAVNAATSSSGHPIIVNNVPITLALRTNPTGTIPIGSADHVIVNDVGLPNGGGRAVTAYAAPETQVLFLIGGCTVDVNANVYFAGRLVDFP
ncbi:MAG: hypothetical protein ACRDIB_16450, partial [Ardenticatenaceae bacterium]